MLLKEMYGEENISAAIHDETRPHCDFVPLTARNFILKRIGDKENAQDAREIS